MSASPKPKPHTYQNDRAFSHRDWDLVQKWLPVNPDPIHGNRLVTRIGPDGKRVIVPGGSVKRRIARMPVRAVFQHRGTGQRREATYVHTVDQSRYPADWLKRITEHRKGRT